MRNWTLLLAGAAGLALIGCTAEAPETAADTETTPRAAVEADAKEVDVAELKQRLDQGEDVFLLDVRSPEELEEHGMIDGAVNIPIDELESRLDEVPKDQPIVTYCMRGGRASRAAETLREHGYDQPIEYGGITAWKEKGYPVVEPDAASE